MKWFDYAAPAAVEEAIRLLSEGGDRSHPLAGGTDLLVQMRSGRRQVEFVVDIKNIPELNELSYAADQGLVLGAAVACHRIYNDADVKQRYPGLVDVASLIGGTLIQGRASIGGNLCNAAPSADAVPMLIALRVSCEIAGPNGRRRIAAEEFCTAPGENALADAEILVSLHFPPPRPHSGARYLRFIPRNEMDIAVVGSGVWVALDGDTFADARIALAAVAPTPLFVTAAGEALVGQPVNDETIGKAAALAREAALPITDMRGTVEYRKHLCEVLTRRALQGAVERAREAR